MRYMIIVKSGQLEKIKSELHRHNATNVVHHQHLNQISADISESAAKKLEVIPGIVVRPVREIKPEEWHNTGPQQIGLESPISDRGLYNEIRPAVYKPAQEETTDDLTIAFDELRGYYSPALTGDGLTVAVLDTGIRKSHKSLLSKVVYEYNCSGANTVDDVWGHGTGVAYLICGEDLDRNVRGVAPGAVVMNIKVINDEGVATSETIIAGIERVIDLVEQARFNGYSPMHPLCPNTINISIGGEDLGDKNDPILVAARSAVEEWQIDVIAAAGNFGPNRSTITVPATEPLVVAVGATYKGSVDVFENSSRGPTLIGTTKPDLMAWGTDLLMASHKGDDKYDTKSGTSFSAPIISGMGGLLWETMRANISPVIAGLYIFRWSEILAYAPYFCVKPQQAAVEKDNTYGYGSPAGATLLSQISGGTQAPTGDVMESMPMIMMMLMMSQMFI